MYNVNDSIFRLYLYAIACKRIHYSTDKNHAHELSDELMDTIIKNTDELAEQYYGTKGKQSISALTIKQDIKEEESIAAICQDVIDILEPLRKNFSKEDKLSGTVSLIDDFKGEMNKIKFLATFDHLK